MVILLDFSDGQSFATGAMPYGYYPATPQETTARLILRIGIAGISARAAVDTGAPYTVCAPTVAKELHLSPADSLGRITLLIRGLSIGGDLFRLPLIFYAQVGDDLSLDATVFVPDAEWEESWGDLPSFIGLSGCLERMRFAVDPNSDMFYFGSL